MRSPWSQAEEGLLAALMESDRCAFSLIQTDIVMNDHIRKTLCSLLVSDLTLRRQLLTLADPDLRFFFLGGVQLMQEPNLESPQILFSHRIYATYFFVTALTR